VLVIALIKLQLKYDRVMTLHHKTVCELSRTLAEQSFWQTKTPNLVLYKVIKF